ncbi:hypothetical protein [uncultured Draconibacterium sp.]|uniref:hypothetical protein n=1 Tax=uncultured Draconibacterium sp. TaxID=1573823 RepID=UPI0025FAA7D8|nr:hypothetical protein [uncultured Draconibacterium sp.]
MNRILKIVFFVVCAIAGMKGSAQHSLNDKLVVFSDRNDCISGDTLWLKVYVPETLHLYGNIIHLQLESPHGARLAGGAVKIKGNHAEGYIAIPDSLQTGLYFAHAFLNAQRKNKNLQCVGRAVYVYNRFEETIEELPVLKNTGNFIPEQNTGAVEIDVASNFQQRMQVDGTIEIANDDFAYIVASATIIDPFSEKNTGFLNFQLADINSVIPPFEEKDGVLLSGQLREKESGKPAQELVLLSVVGSESYFDYYFPDSGGSFHFLLRDAIGNANLILQPLTTSLQEYEAELIPNFVSGVQKIKIDTALLTPPQQEAITNSLKGTFLRKLFYGVPLTNRQAFKMTNPYPVPFFGITDNHVVPDEFFDLPDFKEISRELLLGVQYRNRKDEATFRIINSRLDNFFNSEPLRLINGIPVFKNSFFQNLKSSDIAAIDIVKSERVFGDLRFNGVLAVSLKDKSNSWLAQQPNVFQLNAACIQFPKQTGYLAATNKTMQPDTRQQFYNQQLKGKGVWPFQFMLSDVKGQLEIKVEAITKSGELVKTSKIITIQ